jgi:hypothetical protein
VEEKMFLFSKRARLLVRLACGLRRRLLKLGLRQLPVRRGRLVKKVLASGAPDVRVLSEKNAAQLSVGAQLKGLPARLLCGSPLKKEEKENSHSTFAQDVGKNVKWTF